MIRSLPLPASRFRLSSSRCLAAASALLAAAALSLSAPAYADAGNPAQGAQHAHGGKGHHGHDGHQARHHHASLTARALALPSLSAAQRSQIEHLAQEEKGNHAVVHAARAKVMTALAGQVDRGAIDRAALAPALKEESDAIVGARLRGRRVAEKLHVVLTAKQCEEVGGGKDFLHAAKPESEIRAHAEKHAGKLVERMEKKLPTATAEERARISAHLRARAAR